MQPLNIDMSEYVKLPSDSVDVEDESEKNDDAERKRLLDQNNYLDERNQQLTLALLYSVLYYSHETG